MDFVTEDAVDDVLQRLMPRLGMNLYAGMGDRIFRWSSIASTSITGMGDLAIPVLIAALIVLNTMLGSVFERLKEIHIFSSIGLAPSHVGVLFMAEAFVYAVIGAISGYLSPGDGQVHRPLNLFQGLALNFSSPPPCSARCWSLWWCSRPPSIRRVRRLTCDAAIDRSWKVRSQG